MMKSKKIISFLIASLLLISMCFASYPLVKVDAEEMRDITAFELISEIKIGITNSFVFITAPVGVNSKV